MRQVRPGHDLVLPIGIHARTFAECVLQLLDQVADLIGGAQGPARYVTGHEHDSGTAHPGEPWAHLAQPSTGPRVSVSGERGHDPPESVASHSAPRSSIAHVLSPHPRK